jgi:hypothetical protein
MQAVFNKIERWLPIDLPRKKTDLSLSKSTKIPFRDSVKIEQREG